MILRNERAIPSLFGFGKLSGVFGEQICLNSDGGERGARLFLSTSCWFQRI